MQGGDWGRGAVPRGGRRCRQGECQRGGAEEEEEASRAAAAAAGKRPAENGVGREALLPRARGGCGPGACRLQRGAGEPAGRATTWTRGRGAGAAATLGRAVTDTTGPTLPLLPPPPSESPLRQLTALKDR